jgi:hypothetical protein
MTNRTTAVACVALLCVATLWGSESRAGTRTTMGAEGAKMRGCRDLVTLKHPDAKGPARKKEWDKCMADPDGYNR